MQDFSGLICNSWKKNIQEWLKEDLPSLDYSGFVVGDKYETGLIILYLLLYELMKFYFSIYLPKTEWSFSWCTICE